MKKLNRGLIDAANDGNLKLLKEIIARIPKVLNGQNAHGETALMIAARGRHLHCVKYLLTCGAKVNICDKGGMTALFHAVAAPHNVAIIRLLIEQGCKVNHRDKNGDTPLITFSDNRYYENVLELLKHGGKVNVANKGGDTPLTNAAFWGCERIVQLLIRSGARLSKADGLGCTALYLAEFRGHKKIVRMLTFPRGKKPD